MLKLLASRLCDVPYCVVAHSVGTWIAFELLSRAREEGLPQPLKVFFSCFPSPHAVERPWTVCWSCQCAVAVICAHKVSPSQPQRSLDDAAFKVECRGWDVSDVLLRDEGMWAQYVGLMRGDFTLFDEYVCHRAGEPPFAFPITAFFAENDRKVTPAMVEQWSQLTSASFAVHKLSGAHHLFVLAMGSQRDVKATWLSVIVDELKTMTARRPAAAAAGTHAN